MRANILLIYTGGTIGMIKNAQSEALQAFNFEHLLKSIPELKLLNCSIDAVSFDTPIDPLHPCDHRQRRGPRRLRGRLRPCLTHSPAAASS